MMKRALIVVWAIIGMSACQVRHDVDIAPMEIKPIHITLDINVKVDKALDNFFEDLDEAEKNIEVESTTVE